MRGHLFAAIAVGSCRNLFDRDTLNEGSIEFTHRL